ncbi:UDP-glucuronic acid decarboxylase 5-like [Amborella trichopoda]|uniref:UDP-glucuronic acid decarboxylase 5-like n=1 Tax=Amborella trichopoda TaxID=13333 RepID=UPI0009BFDB30|nr:UDP-glucuronic acid decarboxylase 5-like [Amborella trichopoda]|eukprot:XP_020518607.1 UDP-glucuronic acid decarboxylase 5-like [Amborella trichopoda]
MASNGGDVASSQSTSKPSPSPPPLRSSKFSQVRFIVTSSDYLLSLDVLLLRALPEVDLLFLKTVLKKGKVEGYCGLFIGSKDNLRKWIGHPKFELIHHDVTEPLLIEVDQIYHLSCSASLIFYKYSPVKTIKTNVIGTLNMLGLAKRVGTRILLTSTSEVIEHPQKGEYWGNVSPIEIRIARIFNTYGPRTNIDDGRVVNNFIVQALRDEPLTVQSPGTQTRSFCYVSDMVDGLIRLMAGDHTRPINLGNPGEFTRMELAETVKEVSKLIDSSIPVKIMDNRPDDPR